MDCHCPVSSPDVIRDAMIGLVVTLAAPSSQGRVQLQFSRPPEKVIETGHLQRPTQRTNSRTQPLHATVGMLRVVGCVYSNYMHRVGPKNNLLQNFIIYRII